MDHPAVLSAVSCRPHAVAGLRPRFATKRRLGREANQQTAIGGLKLATWVADGSRKDTRPYIAPQENAAQGSQLGADKMLEQTEAPGLQGPGSEWVYETEKTSMVEGVRLKSGRKVAGWK